MREFLSGTPQLNNTTRYVVECPGLNNRGIFMFDEQFIARFEAKIRKTEGCWEWTASCAGKGYGQMKLPRERKQAYAHRLAYLIYKGEIPPRRGVCHTCDNPKCCNPEHLFLGTSHDNHMDMVSKSRHLAGAKNGSAKLTESEVLQIRGCLALGLPQRKIAAMFDVSQITISRISTGQRWKHIQEKNPE